MNHLVLANNSVRIEFKNKRYCTVLCRRKAFLNLQSGVNAYEIQSI